MDKIEAAMKEKLKSGVKIELQFDDYGILTKSLYKKLWSGGIKLPYMAIRYSYKYNPKTKKVDVTSTFIKPNEKPTRLPVEHQSLTSAAKDLKTGYELSWLSSRNLGYIQRKDGSVESCRILYF